MVYPLSISSCTHSMGEKTHSKSGIRFRVFPLNIERPETGYRTLHLLTFIHTHSQEYSHYLSISISLPFFSHSVTTIHVPTISCYKSTHCAMADVCLCATLPLVLFPVPQAAPPIDPSCGKKTEPCEMRAHVVANKKTERIK